MKYTLTIKDNETGEIEQEVQTNAIIAGASVGKGKAAEIIVSACNGLELITTMLATEKAVKKVGKDNPDLIFAMMAGFGTNDEEERGEENE